MPTRTLPLACLLLAVVSLVSRPAAQSTAVAFYGIGDLPGGAVASVVWDATRVDGTLHAVGSSTLNAGIVPPATVPNWDTPVRWTRDAGGNVTLQALPYLPGVTNGPNPVHTSSVAAYAITPDAQFAVGSERASNTTSGNNWARVNLPGLFTQNLSILSGVSGVGLAVSNDGSVVFGQALSGSNRLPVRYQFGLGTNFADLTPTSKTWGWPIPRGGSADGHAMVGAAANGDVAFVTFPDGSIGTNSVGFRYAHNPGTLTGVTTVLPRLHPGTWQESRWTMPAAISADGSETLVIGDNASWPNGAMYLTNTANEVVEKLGTPNRAWLPRAPGGMTADGSVVGITLSGQPSFGTGQVTFLGVASATKHAYIHNSHGWFHFSSVLAAHGIDLVADSWDPSNLAITGIRTIDGVDLVFGQGRRRTLGTLPGGAIGYINGAVEGFVAVLPGGLLAAFNPQPAPPNDPGLIGAWVAGNPATTTAAQAFMADGTMYRITATGFERGLYTWAGSVSGGAYTVTTLYDTDGGGGSIRNGQLGLSFTVAGDAATFSDAQCIGCAAVATFNRVIPSGGSIIGGWVGGNAAAPDNSAVAIFLDNGRYFLAEDVADDQPANGPDELEIDGADQGTYEWNAETGQLTLNGEPDATIILDRDGLRATVFNDEGVPILHLTRIIDPATIPVIANTPLTASGIAGQAFSYVVTATNTATFSALDLPDGLSIDAAGEISGTPAVGGQFAVTVFATNAIGVSDIETLTLTIAIPTPVGQNVVVEPVVPEGQGPITLSFGEITEAGTTTVTVLDLDGQSQIPPPGNVAIGGVVYEVTTTATYQGLITLCFSYAGIDFGTATPRLFHYENNVWVDITTSVDPGTQTICGATTTLSPFAILVSDVVRTGFYAPVNPITGLLNTVNGGRTVPLKFNVSVSGVAQTTTSGLEMTQQSIACDSSAPEDDVEPAVATGDTNLRFDTVAGHFIFNWKVPRTPGRCYMVRMTTTQDGLALTARFKVR